MFTENPRTSSGNHALAFTTTLTTAHTNVATLSGLSGNCSLQSDRYKVTTDSFFPSYIAAPTTTSMKYTPTQPEFQQLNAFYYAMELRNLLVSLGANLSAMGQVSINSHCNVANNAYFSPSSKLLCMGYADVGAGKKVWASDDGDVVVHEAGHAVNHALSSTSIMNSSGESGAIDEAIADYWALTIMNDGQLSEWFLGALGGGSIRDATQNNSYPASMAYQVHNDSKVLTQVLWDLRESSNLGKATTDALVRRAMQLLPSTTRFKEFYQAFYDASGPAFLNLSAGNRALIVTKFTNKGIHRIDTASGLRLSTAGGAIKQIYVIDDYSSSIQLNGNCNGVLDVGERALVLVNLENPNGGSMGMAVANLTSVPAGITVPSGGGVGEFFRFNANSDFVSSLPAAASSRDEAVYWASFLIAATTSGAKNFTLTYTPMYADATGAGAANPDVTVNFSLNVGTAAPLANCTDNSLWP